VTVSIAVTVLVGLLLAAVIVACGAGLLRARPIILRRRQRAAVARELPDAIDLLVLTIHAGLTPIEAIVELASIAPRSTRSGFELVAHRIRRGVPFADALASLVSEVGPGAAPMTDLIGSAERYGLPLAAALDELARDARATRRRLDEAAARKLAVRLSFPLVTCTLPSFVLLAIAPAVIAALSSLTTSGW
jgi:tight adherence protein C